jgi:phosphoribosyl-ATP pyrophosphohydrolase/phosphoribosyl-AMP cyclohydrolase
MINFEKYADGLAPAIVQDADTRQVLMLGFMNAHALERTRETGLVTFFSRSRRTIWTKGETSGNHLAAKEILIDCDADTILVRATPAGPVCHSGSDTCFAEENRHEDYLFELERVVSARKGDPQAGSYTSSLFASGLNKIAQKVGEEAVELIIEAKDTDPSRFRAEAADLLYHFLVLCTEKGVTYQSNLEVLEQRENPT